MTDVMVRSQEAFMHKQKRRLRSDQVGYHVHKGFHALDSAQHFASSPTGCPETPWVPSPNEVP